MATRAQPRVRATKGNAHHQSPHQAIITCGSKSFTPTQQRYATIELECLAIIWAIQKCEFNLKGLPDFTVATDHRPIWSEWRLTVIAATVRIALVDILDLSEVDIPAGGFLYPAVGWGLSLIHI